MDIGTYTCWTHNKGTSQLPMQKHPREDVPKAKAECRTVHRMISIIKSHPFLSILGLLWSILWIAVAFSEPSEADASRQDLAISSVILWAIGIAIIWIIAKLVSRRRNRASHENTSAIPQNGAQDRKKSDDTAPHDPSAESQQSDVLRTEAQYAPPGQTDPPQSTAVPSLPKHNAAATQTAEPLSPVGHSAYEATTNNRVRSPERQQRGGNLTLHDILKMSPQEFEEFCARALSGMGYKDMKRIGGAGDLQADLIGIDTHGRSTIVQCKRYRPGSKVGSPVIQTFIGMKSVHHGAERGIFMTTADYSQPAINLARRHDIVLIDGDDLVKIAGLVFIPRTTINTSREVRFCTQCGAELEGSEAFCAQCGSPVRRN